MATYSKIPSHCMLQDAQKWQNTRACLLTPTSLGSSSLRKRNISKSFGLKSSGGFRVSAAAYKIKLITPEGIEHEFECPEDEYVLDAAEEAGIDVPYSCRAGSCSTCAGKLESGTVDQSEGSFLDEGQLNQGYLLTCISHPTSDCVIYTHKEEDLY